MRSITFGSYFAKGSVIIECLCAILRTNNFNRSLSSAKALSIALSAGHFVYVGAYISTSAFSWMGNRKKI